MILLKPTHDIVAATGLIAHIEALHLDRGYDNDPARGVVAMSASTIWSVHVNASEAPL